MTQCAGDTKTERTEHKELRSLALRSTQIVGKQGVSEKTTFGLGKKTWRNSITDFTKYECEMIGL